MGKKGVIHSGVSVDKKLTHSVDMGAKKEVIHSVVTEETKVILSAVMKVRNNQISIFKLSTLLCIKIKLFSHNSSIRTQFRRTRRSRSCHAPNRWIWAAKYCCWWSLLWRSFGWWPYWCTFRIHSNGCHPNGPWCSWQTVVK